MRSNRSIKVEEKAKLETPHFRGAEFLLHASLKNGHRQVMSPDEIISHPKSTQDETVSQRIGGIDYEFVPAGNVGCAFDLRDDGRIWAEGGCCGHAAAEAAADDAFEDNVLAESELAPEVLDGEPAAHTRPGR
jgi:hypothetical protein